MIIKTKQFKEVTNTIKAAVDSSNAYSTNLEILSVGNVLQLNITDKEYYVSCKFQLDEPANVNAVVEAPLFVDLIAGITTETFELEDKANQIIIKVGKSSYKLPKIYENDAPLRLPTIRINNSTVEMNISNDILKGIVNINGKEISKAKNIDASTLQKLYYITDEGCFTFTTGACLNSFKLEKPIAILLNDKIVKLFNLFKTDVKFTYGTDDYFGQIQTKISLETEDTYLAAIINDDDHLLNTVTRPCKATKDMINANYSNKLVVSVNVLSAAIARLMMFTKNSVDKANMSAIPAVFTLAGGELGIRLNDEGEEFINYENSSICEEGYSMTLNLADIKLILDSCKDEHITINFGDHHTVVFTRGSVSNLIREN